MSDELVEERRDYSANTLSANELAQTPLEQFTHWMKQARSAKILDASAMALATADKQGQPHVRRQPTGQFVVLLARAGTPGAH